MKADARPAGQLDVDDRLDGAHADAADLDHVGLDFVGIEILVDGGQCFFGAGAQAAGAGPDEDRGTRDGVAAQLGQPLLVLAGNCGVGRRRRSTVQESSSGRCNAVMPWAAFLR